MSRKLSCIPNKFNNYNAVLDEMENDFQYRFTNRQRSTSFGRPLYERINLQMVITQACPFKCSFCLERQNPQGAVNNFNEQIKSLKKILAEHPNARVSITGGEPLLYPEHIKNIISLVKDTATFVSLNTTGKLPIPQDIKEQCHLNISDNSEIHSDLSPFENNENVTVQTIFSSENMTLKNIKNYMDMHPNHKNFSFRYLTTIGENDYNINILNEIRNNSEIDLHTFRIGDFFMYVTAMYKNQHFRITLGDMTLQQNREYKNTYSNLIINAEGEIQKNWNNKK